MKKPELELTKAQVREACRNPFVQTKIKIKSKWRAPIKYKVLRTFQLNKEDRSQVAKALVLATTPTKARMLIGHIPFQGTPQEVRNLRDLLKKTKGDWSYRDISIVKDFEVGVLQFKGLAVCLYMKRQCYEYEPVGPDPIPFGALENDEDIWARLDLFSKSPRELHASVREDLVELTMENEELKFKLRGEERFRTDAELKEFRDLQNKIAELTKNNASLERRLKAVQEAKATKPKPKTRRIK